MLRRLFLFFCLIGLAFLDWSCGGSCGHGGPYDVKLTGINSEVWVVDSSGIIIYDSGTIVPYKNLQFDIDIVTERVSSKYSFTGFSAYADDCDVAAPALVNQIDSVSILSSIGGVFTEVSNDFGIVHYYNDSILVNDKATFLNVVNRNSPYENLVFYMTSGPEETLERRYTFQFFDTDGNVFETTTMPIQIRQ